MSAEFVDADTVLALSGVVKHFPIRAGVFGRPVGYVHAVDDVSLDVHNGETVALVGESGCGKSTLGRCVVRLVEPDKGQINFQGSDIANISMSDVRAIRADLQMVFQDPSAALTSHIRIGEQLEEPIRLLLGIRDQTEIQRRIHELLDTVGLPRDAVEKYPHEFSGGQKQRICIARALASEPELIVCDEAVSALDVSIKAQIINLLIDIQQERGVGYLFISHDLGIVECISHRTAVMYLGKIVEIGDTAQIFDNATHPYTQALLSAAPATENLGGRFDIQRIQGDVPSASSPPSGCRFRTRCPLATNVCSEKEPKLAVRDQLHAVACHHR